MNYTTFSLNGAWEMDYREDAYTGTDLPQFKGHLIQNAIPGYWEDMTEAFLMAPFFRALKVNPAFGAQQYPIATTAPDMALPNYVGNFFYRKNFIWEKTDEETVIHFGGVQNALSVWVNGVFLGRHEGYTTPFDFSIPADLLKDGENTVVLSVSNLPLEGHDGEYVIGLMNRAVNEYSGGLTGEIELRTYNSPIRDVYVLISEDLKKAEVKIEATEKGRYNWVVYDDDNAVKSGSADGDFEIDTSDLAHWSPENPKLYKLEIMCLDSSVTAVFGVRRLLADGVKLKLNGNPCFLRGACEHCYFPDTVHPVHDAKFYRNVVKILKSFGFNFLRFHTFVPEEEYLDATDELGMMVHIESPGNTTEEDWERIVKYARRHPSVVIYCCGNELLIDEPFIEHLNVCADTVHKNTDGLFSPLSALRGLEYGWRDEDLGEDMVEKPFKHNPRRIDMVSKFSDVYSSYANGYLSYFSLDGNPEELDAWSAIYNKPRLSHEICIDGSYTDLSLKDRYKNSRIGKTDMFSSIERHLEDKGILDKAPTYFKNSSMWQSRIRKYCFEMTRRLNNMAGFDFLGPIDTHWHTFGYDVGMMNEFYELKPGESVRNVLMYNSETVILNDLMKKANFESGEELKAGIYLSHYGKEDIKDGKLNIRLSVDGKVYDRKSASVDMKKGEVSKVYDLSITLPEVKNPKAMKLSATLDSGELYAENEWELYLFPKVSMPDAGDVIISKGMDKDELIDTLRSGKDVVILGSEPFSCFETSFRIGLAGRTSDNLSTIVHDHPILKDLPHEGFCSWQFSGLMQGGKAVCFENKNVPFNPIVEVASPHKYAVRQSSLFEYNVEGKRLLVCSMNFDEKDPGANWLKARLVEYATGDEFNPEESISEAQLYALINGEVQSAEGNKNFAFNINDKTAVRRKK